MRGLALIGVLASLSGVACDDCGLYQYKGVRTVEWCGDVYGSEGTLQEGTEEVSSAEITFRHTVPPGEFYFEHSASVRALFLWADLESGETFGAERIFSVCRYTDFGDPLVDGDEVLIEAPAAEITLQGHGGGFNLDPANSTVREVSWQVVCGDGVFRLNARDKVKFDHAGTAQVLHPDLAAWLEGGGGGEG